MELVLGSKDANGLIFILPAFLRTKALCDSLFLLSLITTILTLGLLTWVFSTGGIAWRNGRNRRGHVPIPGPRGLPIFGSLFALRGGLAHRTLAAMASSRASTELMAFSLGSTPVVVASDPRTAREILSSPYFSDRPLKQSARKLMFSRAIGFAPSGTYWRLLRRIASSHLFAPRRILAHEAQRQQECTAMLAAAASEQAVRGMVGLRKHLQIAALNGIMGCVFGRRYDSAHNSEEAREVREMVREGFELLGAFNWSDYLPWMSWVYDPNRIARRCEDLLPRVRTLVKGIIEEHKGRGIGKVVDGGDFVDVLLGLEGEEKLDEDDMIAVLWEMIFRGTDTMALLTEWVMAELVLNQDIQARLQEELDRVVGRQRTVTDADVANLPYLKAVVKETLRAHPPGPLLSWARLSTSDVQLSNGMVVPAHTTTMVNMWAITHDSLVWNEPYKFKPERFLSCADVDVRGSDLRLAPFGAGRRVCPGRELGLVTVHLWVAKLAHHFKWVPHAGSPVDLSEVLKLSCEIRDPLSTVALLGTSVFPSNKCLGSAFSFFKNNKLSSLQPLLISKSRIKKI